MRAVIAALAISLLPLPLAAAEQVKSQTFSLGCTNSSDQQWAETEAGIRRMFGAEGRFSFSREASTVTVTGPEGTRHGVAEMTKGLPDATCKAAMISYKLFQLPAETDVAALLRAVP